MELSGALLFFLACWFGVLGILSLVSGWPSLAERFPPRTVSAIDRRRFHFVSGAVGQACRVALRSALVCGVSSDGLELSVLPLFRFMHPPMFIPWTAVRAVTHERRWLVMTTVVRLRESPAEVHLIGGAADAVRELWERVRGASG